MKATFNNLIDNKIACGVKINEVILFTTLKQTFQTFAFADILHGSSGMVEFAVSDKTSMITVQCEVADLLIVSFSKSQIRYTLLQNKTMHNMSGYYGLGDFKINVRQHYLLTTKPLITPRGSSNYLFPDILSSGILDSVSSYGVFYKVKNLITGGYTYNMNYSIANRLKLNSPIKTSQIKSKSERKSKFIGIPNKIVSKSGYKEVEGCLDLDDFEVALKNMLIGTPISKGNINHINLINNIRNKLINESIKSDKPSRVKFLNTIRELELEKNMDNGVEMNLPDVILIDCTNENQLLD
ncbi:hypothetical protein JV173_03600 [Acholeplasma equirhinis]|uniref:hypothetical protein n=1 Tax=Acholeplasma equirhinis TaxID=555393 RepID=UPI00197ACF7F|nr:hypothetical protein [Acholeplasma equirhinis]MBN3490595.1 hypothetical protein [Acholeplasma equirhinis]